MLRLHQTRIACVLGFLLLMGIVRYFRKKFSLSLHFREFLTLDETCAEDTIDMCLADSLFITRCKN